MLLPIKIKRGSGVPGSLAAGELAVDTTTGNLYVGTGASIVRIGRLPAGGTAGQLLQKSSGTDFDAAWTSLPNYSFCAAMSANQSIEAGATAAIGFDQDTVQGDGTLAWLHDPDGAYDASNFYFTAPVNGQYQFDWVVWSSAWGNANCNSQLMLQQGGAGAWIIVDRHIAATTGSVELRGGRTLLLAANDRVQVRVTNAHSSSITINAGTAPVRRAQFSGHLVRRWPMP